MENPEFYNDLDLSFAKAWDLIEPGVLERNSPAHTPVVATVDQRAQPQMRVMVLRQANRFTRRLRFHTDSRATKIAEIEGRSSASVLMYDAAHKLQLRLWGTALIEPKGSEADRAWQQSTTFARRCYMAETPPGTVSEFPTSGLPDWIEGKQPKEDDLIDARANFAILWFEVNSLEMLYLANVGHRRAKWDYCNDSEQWSGRWLVP